MRRVSIISLLVAALSLSLASVAFAQQSGQTYTAALNTLNNSGASGTATVTVNGDQATVNIQSSGLLAGAPHAQHIHVGGQNVCPPPSADTDGDGLISTPEGAPFYGGVQVSLTTTGDISPDSGFAVDRFPVADASGDVNYSRTFTLPDGVTAADLAGGSIVQHGVDLNGSGAYDAAAGQSPAMPELPFETTIPAVCGELVAATMPDTGGISPVLVAGIGGAAMLFLGGTLLVVRRRDA